MGNVFSIQMPYYCATEQSVPIPQPEASNEVMQSLNDEEQHQQRQLQQGLSEIEAETTQVDELRNDSSQETKKSSGQEQVAPTEVMQSLHEEEQQQQQLLQQGLSEIEAETTEVDQLISDSSQETEKSSRREQIAATDVTQSLQEEERQQQHPLQQGLSEITAETTEVDELRSDSSQETEKSSRHEQIDTTEVTQSGRDEERQLQHLLQQGLSEIKAETTEVDELPSDSSQETKKSRQEHVATTEVMQSLQDEERQHQQLLQQGISENEAEITEVHEMRSDKSKETEKSPSQEKVASTPEDLVALKHEEISGIEYLLQKICDCLLHEQVGILGIHGSPGVGKTTLLTTVYNKFCSTPNDFDFVIWVTVSQAQRLTRIQADMWKQICIYDGQWENKRFHEKATDIFNVLSKKRFLLFLDELTYGLDLTEVGVPLQRSDKRSKTVLIASDAMICREMGAEKQIMVLLTEIDAWKLFEKEVGEELLYHDPLMPRIAGDIVVTCRGLPLLLNVFAHFMAKKKTVQEWSKAHWTINMRQINAHFFILASIYKSLPNQRVKSCFIYCLLFPPASKILKDDLVSYWMCESFWENNDSGVDVADNEGYQIIDTLVDACLLEDKGNYLTMHPLVWHEVLQMVSDWQLEKLFVKVGSGLVEAPEVREWQVNGMSLFGNNIPNLQEVPVCPNLRTLLLCHNPRLAMIIDGFFQHMPALTVLDLSNTSINELPLGISKLVSLQYLNISRTWIEQLPDEVRFLSRLKCLNLEYNGLLRFISRQIISSLSMLQILKTFSCGVSLVQSEDNILSYGNEHVNELQGLEHLKKLSITITSAVALQSLFNIPNLRTCTKALSLKCFWGTRSLDISLLANMTDLEMLEIYQIDQLEGLKVDSGIKKTEIQEFDSLYNSTIPRERSFNSLKEVMMGKCVHLRELTWVVLAPNLRVLKVVDCKEMEEVISINKLDEVSNVASNPFFNLEVILLEELPKLKSIYWSALPFPCLKKIKIVDCPLLKRLPLNSNSAMGKVVIFYAEERWWNGIDWEDDATRIAFLRGFVDVL